MDSPSSRQQKHLSQVFLKGLQIVLLKTAEPLQRDSLLITTTSPGVPSNNFINLEICYFIFLSYSRVFHYGEQPSLPTVKKWPNSPHLSPPPNFYFLPIKVLVPSIVTWHRALKSKKIFEFKQQNESIFIGILKYFLPAAGIGKLCTLYLQVLLFYICRHDFPPTSNFSYLIHKLRNLVSYTFHLKFANRWLEWILRFQSNLNVSGGQSCKENLIRVVLFQFLLMPMR